MSPDGLAEMAITHLRLTPVKKAGTPIGGKIKGGTVGRSSHHTGTRLSHGAAGKSAYLCAGRIAGVDGIVTDYRRKFGVEHSELVLPGGGSCDREKLWNAVDAHPTKSEKADVAYDVIVAFPSELSSDERKTAAREFAGWIAERYQVAVDYGMHLPETHKGADERNFHGHYLISARKVSPTGELGHVQRELNHRHCARVDFRRGRTERRPTPAKEIRDAWQQIANGVLAAGGHHERIDMRSYKAQGVDRKPGVYRSKIEMQRLREERQRGPKRPQTVGQMRDHARAAIEHATERETAARGKIAAIQKARRQAPEAAIVHSRIGDADDWYYDPAGQFVKAWAAADRASLIRKRIATARAIRPPMREPTEDERKALRQAGREISRAKRMKVEAEKALRASEHLNASEVFSFRESARGNVRSFRNINRRLQEHGAEISL